MLRFTSRNMKLSFSFRFLVFTVVFSIVGFIFGNKSSILAQTTNVSSSLSCKVHPFLVSNSYQLPFKYDSPEIVNGSTINTGDSFVYLFEILNNTGKERVTIKKVTTTQIVGANEPIDIIQTRPLNGSCSVNSVDKSIVCNISYSFAESAHYPIEYLFRVTDNPSIYPKTSSLFTIETDAGTTQCASMLMIRNQEKLNKISWGTPYAKLSSENFYIKIGDKKFFGKDPIKISSDPGTEKTTLEAIWQENDVEMRLFMYFRKVEGNMWEIYELRSYNGQKRGDWIYYKESLGNKISSLVGQHNYAFERKFIPIENNTINAEIYCKGCSINAFIPQQLPISNQGYSLQALIGLPNNEIITLSTDPKTGYGVNVLLKDKEGSVVKDQGSFSYEWSARDAKVVGISSGPIELENNGCAYGINKPCPNMNADLTGLTAGKTKIVVTVKRLSDNVIIAKTSFPVVVKEFGSTTPIEKNELGRLQQEVNKLSDELNKQQTALYKIQQTVNQITNFLKEIFKSLFNS